MLVACLSMAATGAQAQESYRASELVGATQLQSLERSVAQVEAGLAALDESPEKAEQLISEAQREIYKTMAEVRSYCAGCFMPQPEESPYYIVKPTEESLALSHLKITPVSADGLSISFDTDQQAPLEVVLLGPDQRILFTDRVERFNGRYRKEVDLSAAPDKCFLHIVQGNRSRTMVLRIA